MKYQIGDKVIILHSNEEGEIVDLINEKMVMIEVDSVRYPIYMDQIDFPYFKMFTEKRKQNEVKTFIDNVRKVHEQIIDMVNIDEVTNIEPEQIEPKIIDVNNYTKTEKIVHEMEQHTPEIRLLIETFDLTDKNGNEIR